MAEAIPRFPPEMTILRVRRGATEGLARTKNRLYAVRRVKVSDALRWAEGAFPITRMLSCAHPGSPTSSTDRKSMALRLCIRRRESSQRNKAQRPTRSAQRSAYLERRLELGECSPLEVATDYQEEAKFLETARFQSDGRKSAPSFHGLAQIRTLCLRRALAGSSSSPSPGYFLAASGAFSMAVRSVKG